MIVAVVLAAGESRRMGTQKLLLPFGDTTVVGAVARTARGSRIDRALVVLGADADEVRRALEGGAAGGTGDPAAGGPPGVIPETEGQASKDVVFTLNPAYRTGMLSSVQAGFRALPPDVEAAVVMLGDQPFLGAGTVDAVVAAYRESGAGIVIPVFRGKRGHPVLVDLKYREEVLGIDPSDGLRRLMRDHPGDIREVEVGDANVLRDLDTPADYQEGVRSKRAALT